MLRNKATASKERASNIDIENNTPIMYTKKTGNWPKKFSEPDPNISQQLTKKKSFATISYSQGVKKAEYPRAYTLAFETRVLEPAGIMMDQQLGEEAIPDSCKKLCTTLVNARYDHSQNFVFEWNLFWKVLNGVRSGNKARVVSDILPWLIPSAELPFICGLFELKDSRKEIQGDWTKCFLFVCPLPRPDFTVGFWSSTFTGDKIKKLKYPSLLKNPTLFTGDLYFPFLIFEVKVKSIINNSTLLCWLAFAISKCDNNGLNIADRQHACSASTVVNSILQLYPTLSRAE